MKKNHGFIATSLLYSFFLVFIALLLALVGTYLHNRVVLNVVINNIKEELSLTGKKTLKDAPVGSYVDIPLYSTGVKISTDLVKWIVFKQNTANKAVYLVSDNPLMTSSNHQNISVLQTELDRFHNLYTTSNNNLNHISYLIKSDITSFESNNDLQIRKSLLSEGSEYFYFDPSTNRSYLYKYTCDKDDICKVEKNQAILTNDKDYYGLRFVIVLSDATPISSGIGTVNDPYNVLYYVTNKDGDDVLKLHYDHLNSSGNTGFRTSGNYLVDLSGNNDFGQLNTGNYTNHLSNGLTIPASRLINTNLLTQSIINNSKGYTIEFRALNNIRLSSYSTYLDNFIKLTNNTSLKLYNTSIATGVSAGSFNTFTIIKKPGVNTLSLYINGEKINANPANLLTAANNLLYLGGSTSAEIFKSIRVYNVALDESDIVHNYSVDLRWSL